jgi:hypothetical protein
MGDRAVGSGNRHPRERTLVFLSFLRVAQERLTDFLKTSGELAKEVHHLS